MQGRGAADDPPQFRAPPAIRRLRDVTRYRADLVGARTAEKQRAEKLLEDACIKLSVVASDIFGVSGRAMMAALVAGQRDPTVLAQLARGRMRAKITALEDAFTGHFTDHHAFLLDRMLARVDAINADIAALDAKIEELITPFAAAVDQLDEVFWHLLSDPQARYHDLGPDFYDTHISNSRKMRNHVRQLQALGYKVTLEPAA